MDNRPPNPLTFNGSTRFLLPNNTQPPTSTSTTSSSSSTFAVPLSQQRRSSTPGPAYTFPMPGQIPRSSASSPGPETRFRTASQLFSLRPRDIDDVKIAIFMVGLPARGKSYISQKMRRWLSWCGYPTRVFNVGNARRQVSKIVSEGDGENHQEKEKEDEGRSDGGVPIPNAGRRGVGDGGGEGGGQLGLVASSSLPTLETVGELGELKKGVELGVLGKTQSSNFFDPNDKEKTLLRDHLAMNVLEEMIEWLHSGFGCVGIHDATNTTIERREALLKRLETEPNIQVIFIESVCSNPEVLRRNIDLKTSSPDYKEMPKEEAKKDFEQRLKNYEKAYQPIPDEDKGVPFIKIIDVGQRVIANRIQGYLQSQIVFYLMNIHIHPRKIHLVRAGQTNDAVSGRLGRDLPLNSEGLAWSKTLGGHIKSKYSTIVANDANQRLKTSESPEVLQVWSSALIRAVQTAKAISPYTYRVLRTLNELNTGACEGMTKEEIREKMPLEFEARETDKLAYRYPGGGESYLDVIERVRPLIVELERLRNSVIVISHSAVLRTLYAYFMDISQEEVPYIDIPANVVITLSIGPYSAECEVTPLN